MGTISAWIPDDLEADLETYLEEEHVDRCTAVRTLLADGLADWRRERALDRLADGEVSVARAAELADVSVWELTRLAEERDVTWVGDQLRDDLDAL